MSSHDLDSLTESTTVNLKSLSSHHDSASTATHQQHERRHQASELKAAELLLHEREQLRREGKTDRDRQKRTNLVARHTHQQSLRDSISRNEAKIESESIKIRQLSAHQRQRSINYQAVRELFHTKKLVMKELEKMQKYRRLFPFAPLYHEQDEEFFGVRFEQNAHDAERRSELLELAQQRILDLLKSPEHSLTMEERGAVVIKALVDSANLFSTTDPAMIYDLIKSRKFVALKRNSTVTMDVPARTPNLSLTSSLLTPVAETGVNAYDSAELSLQSESNYRAIKVASRPIRNAPATLDFSEYFDGDVGKRPGLLIFRIDSMRPVLAEKSVADQGLCLGDCYIFLHTFAGDDASRSNQLGHNLFHWLGEDASVDKKACSAIYSVALRNLMNTSNAINREEPRVESKEFCDLLSANDLELRYISAEESTSSALYEVRSREYPLLVYRIYHNHPKSVPYPSRCGLFLVEPSKESLKASGVYLIDEGLRLVQWNGNESSVSDRARCRFYANILVSSERPPGKAIFEETNQHQPFEASHEIIQNFPGAYEPDGKQFSNLIPRSNNRTLPPST